MTTRTAYEASRALSGSNVIFRGEFEVVSDADVKALTDYARTQVRKSAKLRIFVAERKQQRKL